MIQVDLFEVGLGAALLLQFDGKDGAIRVLADGGVEHGRHPGDVLPRLDDAFRTFGDLNRRIDLVIGTHYDADHLEGLVPIIEDTTIDICEAWLPPVEDDTSSASSTSRPGSGPYLAQIFASGGRDALLRYLRAKAATIQHVRMLRARLEDEIAPEEPWDIPEPDHRLQANNDELLSDEGFFERSLSEARQRLGMSEGHADEAVEEPLSLIRLTDFVRSHVPEPLATMMMKMRPRPSLAALDYIEKSTAKDAITAKSLNKVVEALVHRGIQMRCQTIKAGQPRKFIWNGLRRRFVEAPAGWGPELLLMAPSRDLVARHQQRLPVSQVAFFARLLPIRSITPSNELSYVMRFRHDEQNILVCGDTGFVDFKPLGRKAPFYGPLIRALKSLAVIQVAHHGGSNAYFYRALIAAKYDRQKLPSFLLLSHGVHDAKRPNAVFDKFIDKVRFANRKISLLFTSQPLPINVVNFVPLIEPVRGTAPPADRGDVRLSYDRAWKVLEHRIKV